MDTLYLVLALSPLVGAIIAGLFGKKIGRAGAHWVTIIGVAISFVLSLIVFNHIVFNDAPTYNATVYQWLLSDAINFEIGFLIDELTATMLIVVTFVSLMVHIYTIGYMRDDPGYQRFFSYISLFTFSMLMLVMANNFMQLFFGWEAVGLVSYLLIGFWYKKPTAIYANLKAFLVNRVGDFGFLLGIAAVLMYFGSLDYAEVFAGAEGHAETTISLLPGVEWSLMTVICILLFIGAMGKSAQVPLHVWLPDSMEGPTPISALIHAATMVTAGIFMVSRMSPLFELSETALSFVLIIGSITALFMAFLGLIQNDIKRVIAYSTLSQLGYMTVALGVSAYSAAMFHLMTHAFFKALLFLAAGSVIIAMHHEQDMRKMGGLRKRMPITYWTALIGSLALMGIPPFSGFFSKDTTIEAVGASTIAGSSFAYFAVITGVFVTAFYSMRLLFLTFHGKPRMDEHTLNHVKESPKVVTVPLILLAIPSVLAGWIALSGMPFGDYFGDSIVVFDQHNSLAIAKEMHGGDPWHFMIHGVMTLPFWLVIAAIIIAWVFYIAKPEIPGIIASKFCLLRRILDDAYGIDRLYYAVFAKGSQLLGKGFFSVGDTKLIDGILVDGTANSVARFAGIARRLQTGFLYHYAFAMIIGLLVLIGWFVLAR